MSTTTTRRSRNLFTALLIPALLLMLTAPAAADWPNENPTKWVQLPDRQPTGMDVLDTFPKILADDFRCTFTGPITDVHIWGSWLNDQLPRDPTGQIDPTRVGFKLSFHKDIPATPTAHSRPENPPLWVRSFAPGTFVARLDGVGQESFFDPNVNQIIGFDTQIWQYNFRIPESEAFKQEFGNIYWLDVQAFVEGNERFGWKTSLDHFNDDAVFGDTPTAGGDPAEWRELIYPAGHPFQGQSIDLAFALTTIPEPGALALSLSGVLVLLGCRRR